MACWLAHSIRPYNNFKGGPHKRTQKSLAVFNGPPNWADEIASALALATATLFQVLGRGLRLVATRSLAQ